MKIKFTFLSILFKLASTAAGGDLNPDAPSCKPPCSESEVCMNIDQREPSRCAPVPDSPNLTFYLPFDSSEKIFCTHGNGVGSHSWANAFFALDLANDYLSPPAIVRSAADGVAYVFQDDNGKLCPEPKGNPEKAEISSCGDGWGNRVKILHESGYFSFYAHLDRALVKTGDAVHQGQPIGVEGWTGLAGHRHLHWSVQKLLGKNRETWANQIKLDTGESVPFRFTAAQQGATQLFDVRTLACTQAGVGHQPNFTGIEK